MNPDYKNGDPVKPFPGESTIPILPVALSESERISFEEKRKKQASDEVEAAYKQRQTALAESTNKLAVTNTRLTWALALFTEVSAGGSIYQGCQTNNAVTEAHTANEQTREIARNAAADSSRQFKLNWHILMPVSGFNKTRRLMPQFKLMLLPLKLKYLGRIFTGK